MTPERAFETFKGLRGKWAIQSSGKTLAFEMTYEVASNGSIVTEQFGKELSVIYPDGQNVLMTHFCNRGNQPRLRLKANDRHDVFEFEMFDITNLKSADAPHVQRIVYRITDKNRIELQILWKTDKGEQSEDYTLVRKLSLMQLRP